MGNFLRALMREEDHYAENVFVDFENAEPTEAEQRVYEECVELLEHSHKILEQMESYEGADSAIRLAILNPESESHQRDMWNALAGIVTQLKTFYDFAQLMEKVVPKILWHLCTSEPPLQHLEANQATTKMLAHILDFVLTFDQLKMRNPSIQNAFSHYRRMMNRLENDASQNQECRELTNRMSLFFAQPTPMLNTLAAATSEFVASNKNLPIEHTTETIATMTKVCQKMVENRTFCDRFERGDKTVLFIIRVMVGTVILYDHVHPQGAFVRSSKVDVKGCVRALREHPAVSDCVREELMNVIRYTTIHLKEDTTPKHIKNLFAG